MDQMLTDRIGRRSPTAGGSAGRLRGGLHPIVLPLIGLAGLVIRIVYILGWNDPYPIPGDSAYYHIGANIFAEGRGFPQPISIAFAQVKTPGADHPPAYIVFLGLASRLGFRTVLEHQIWTAMLGSATIVLVGHVGQRLGGWRVALAAAVGVAVFPPLWFSDARLAAETIAGFATVLVIIAAYRCWDRPSAGAAALLGAALGLAALSRSELLLLAPVVVVPLAWSLRRELARAAAVVLVAAVTTSAVIAPWAIYNLSRFDDETVILSNQLDRTMAASYCDKVFRGRSIGYKSYACLIRVDRQGDTPEEDRVNYAKAWKRYAKEHIADLPAVGAARVGRVWGLFRPIQQIRAERGTSALLSSAYVGMVMTWVLMAAAVVGAVRLRRRGVPLSPLLAPAVVISIAAAITFGQLRYRSPAEPALVLLAATALAPAAAKRGAPDATDRPAAVGGRDGPGTER